ncbi:hypothetical protein [Bradyrhizobium sp. LMG 9283]|uniref:hypothetical protein n=1 Tax=Bradyrhizobium sp. LMG 9283 TaxID=592064 RepID=UPI0038904BA4
MPLTADTHAAALTLARDHNFAFYDALIVATAIEAGCDSLHSEDLQHGRSIAGLTIINPFVGNISPSPRDGRFFSGPRGAAARLTARPCILRGSLRGAFAPRSSRLGMTGRTKCSLQRDGVSGVAYGAR